MAIKDLMKATEADRYTADGRDQLNEALQADVKDRVYKPHEISPKTGLEKQDDGSWAPPKKGGTPGAKAEEGTLKPSRKPDQKKHPLIKNPDVLGMTANGARKRMEAFGAQFVENKNGKDYFKTTSGDLVEVEYGDNKKVLSSTTYTGGEKPEQVYPTTAGHNIESYINKLHEEGWKNDGWERNSANGALGYFKKGDKTIRVMQNWNGTLGGVSEIKPKTENKPAGSKPAAENNLEPDFEDEGESAGTNWQEKVEQNPRDGYNFEKMIQHRIPTSQTDREELKGLRSFMNEEKATYQNALKSRAQALVDGHKSNGDWYPEKEQSIMKIAKAVGYDEELHKFIEEENRGYDLGYSEDEAPKIRELTGDCKIRIRKA